jgi:hypothetical protein
VEINAAYARLLPWMKQGRPADLVDEDERWARWAAAWRRQSEAENARRRGEWEAEQARREEVRRNTRVYTARETADLVKKAMRAAFPGVSFRVTVSRPTYSMRRGARITVTWVDGPSHWDVKAVTDAYEGEEHYDDGGDYLAHRDRLVPDGEGNWKRYDIQDFYLHQRESKYACPACGRFQWRRPDWTSGTLVAVCGACGHRWPMYGEKSDDQLACEDELGTVADDPAAVVEMLPITPLGTLTQPSLFDLEARDEMLTREPKAGAA